jgi:hypothetical protein
LGLPMQAETFAALLRKGNHHPYRVDAHRRAAGLEAPTAPSRT